MNKRTAVIVAAVLLGLTGGPVLLHTQLPAAAHGDAVLPWPTFLLVLVGCAIGLPFLLISLVSNGNYQAMVRAWSVFGVLAILCAAAGLSALTWSVASSRVDARAALLCALGMGLFAGLGIVKLTLRRARAKRGG